MSCRLAEVEARVDTRSTRNSAIRVSIADLDSGVGFLPELITKANNCQAFFLFRVDYLPIPGGYEVTDASSAASLGLRVDGTFYPHTYADRLSTVLANAPERLNVSYICCLTKNLLMSQGDGVLEGELFSTEVPSNKSVSLVSTYNLRSFAVKAGISFAAATLRLCLGQVLATMVNIDFHSETASCLFDDCDNRTDVVEMLQSESLTHEPCRTCVETYDPELLVAVNALLRLRED